MKKNTCSLGLDISECHYAFVALARVKKIIKIEHYGYFYDSNKAIKQSELINQLKNELFQKKRRTKSTVIAIPSLMVLKKTIPISIEFNENDIEIYLKLSQQKLFPNIQDKLIFDFSFSTQPAKNQTKNIHLFATRKTTLNERIEMIKKLGLKATCIDIDSYALLQNLKSLTLKRTNLLIYSSDQNLRLIIFSNNEILYEQNLLYTSQNEILQMILKTINSFEINHSNTKTKTEQIFLFAGYDPIKNTLNDLKIPIAIINPFQNILTPNCENFKKNKNQLLIALGLALRGLSYD